MCEGMRVCEGEACLCGSGEGCKTLFCSDGGQIPTDEV